MSDDPPSDTSIVSGEADEPEGEDPGSTRETRMSANWYEGPIPPPDLVAGYEAINPGSAAFFFDQVSRNADHRRVCERDALLAEINDRRSERTERMRGQFFGLSIAVSAFVFSAVIIIMVPTSFGATVASIMSGTTVVALVGAFVLGRRWEHASDRPSQADHDDEHELEPHPGTRTASAQQRDTQRHT